jgi:hypothetical protein
MVMRSAGKKELRVYLARCVGSHAIVDHSRAPQAKEAALGAEEEETDSVSVVVNQSVSRETSETRLGHGRESTAERERERGREKRWGQHGEIGKAAIHTEQQRKRVGRHSEEKKDASEEIGRSVRLQYTAEREKGVSPSSSSSARLVS